METKYLTLAILAKNNKKAFNSEKENQHATFQLNDVKSQSNIVFTYYYVKITFIERKYPFC